MVEMGRASVNNMTMRNWANMLVRMRQRSGVLMRGVRSMGSV